MKLYRVCTENKNYQDIANYLDEHFPDGYTIINANGAWQGVREKSLVIEIMGEHDTHANNIGKFAYWLKKHNKQQAVMVQILNITEQII